MTRTRSRPPRAATPEAFFAPPELPSEAREHSPVSAPLAQPTSDSGGSYRPPDAVSWLYAHGAHFVLCDGDKKPLWSRYLLRRPSVQNVLAHDGPVGIFPSSIDLTCLDVDKVADPYAVVRLAAACHTEMVVRSRRPEGRHIFVPDDLPRPNGSFDWLGCSGDIRGATGYVIMWDPDVWDVLDRYVRHPSTAAPVGLPYALVSRCGRSNGSAQHEDDGGRRRIRLEGVEHSQRHPALFDEVRHRAYRQDRGHDRDRWMLRVLDYSRRQNRRLRDPLPDHEVMAMADRIGRWVWENCVHKPNTCASLDPAERSERARKNGIKSGRSRRRGTPLEHDSAPWESVGQERSTWYRTSRWAGDSEKMKPPRQLKHRAWERLGISRSAWYRRLQKIRAGEIPKEVHSGWDHLGMDAIAPWECLGLTPEEWDTFATELNPPGGGIAKEESPAAQQQPGTGASADYLDRVAEYAVELVETSITAVPPERSLVIPIGERQALGRILVAMQRRAAFEARKVDMAHRRAFHRRMRREATERRREEARRIRESLRTAVLDFLYDCEDARIEEERESGVKTASWIARPVRVPGYDPTNREHRQYYAMMMRDVDRKDWDTACRLFRRAQQRGEQPLVPPWLVEAVMHELELADEWRCQSKESYYGIAAVA